jgi:Holliday junction resolvase RusA-like endonuclease
VWADDTQIVDGQCMKRYAASGEPPSTVVTVTEVA